MINNIISKFYAQLSIHLIYQHVNNNCLFASI